MQTSLAIFINCNMYNYRFCDLKPRTNCVKHHVARGKQHKM